MNYDRYQHVPLPPKFSFDFKVGQMVRRLRIEHHMKKQHVTYRMQLLGVDIDAITLGEMEMGRRRICLHELFALRFIFRGELDALLDTLTPEDLEE